jgi:hypothetical protein
VAGLLHWLLRRLRPAAPPVPELPAVTGGGAEVAEPQPGAQAAVPEGENSPDRLDQALDRLRHRIPGPPDAPPG